jgi:hypothetical protein
LRQQSDSLAGTANGEAARDLTGRVAAHAVGDDEQPGWAVGTERVLVLLADPPDV